MARLLSCTRDLTPQQYTALELRVQPVERDLHSFDDISGILGIRLGCAWWPYGPLLIFLSAMSHALSALHIKPFYALPSTVAQSSYS